MKNYSIIKSFPTGNPVAEIAKIAVLIAATVVIDALSEAIKDALKESKSPLGDVIIKEGK